VPEGQPGASGSHVLTMRWIHDLEAFDRLTVEDQQQVFGRTKADSIEFVGAKLPPNAHIARTQIHDDGGEEIPIYRRNVPYGTTREAGVYFLGFGADHDRFDRMLRRMFGPSDDGLHDRLTDFSRPVSGAYYFAPSLTLLAKLAGRP
jgi:putative iron-dependent peroxidase